MMRVIVNISAVVCVMVVLLSSCKQKAETYQRASGFEEFLVQYNDHIERWLGTEAARIESEISKLESQESTEAVSTELKGLHDSLETIRFRQQHGEYFQTKTLADIPTGLSWEDGMEHEEIGDPRAVKGGTFRQHIITFPPTIRGFGPNSNSGFRGLIYDEIDVPLVALHPKSMAIIPGLAREWAVSTDGRTVYFRLHKDVTYSDGKPLVAKHFFFGAYIQLSDNVSTPSISQYMRENIAGITVYDDYTLSVTLPQAKIYTPLIAGVIDPLPPHFYDEYGPDFKTRYQWKFPPTTGAYEVKPEDIVKGVSITQTRVKNWWAKDKKYFKYRYNPDRIRHVVVRDDAKAFELFRAGELDWFRLTRPQLWYEKSMIDPVFDGYIERYTFYDQYPALPRGLYLNVIKPLLNEKTIRQGIGHAMHWQKVIDVVHRGDYQRLNAFNEGYLQFSDPTIKAREYSVSKARALFAEAGFTKVGSDGILMREDGTRLSISVTYTKHPLVDKMMSILREDALACGFELRLDSNESVLSFKKIIQKQHEIAFLAWVITPPIPDYYRLVHSSTAIDRNGNVKPQTNNIFSWARKDTDILAEKTRTATNDKDFREAALKLQNIVHDEAIFVPAYNPGFLRVGSWRWVRWPDSDETKFAPPVIHEATEAHVHWVDDRIKKQTLEARRAGKKFPEVERVFDDYRYLGEEAVHE